MEVEDAPGVRQRELVEIELDDSRWTELVTSNGDALPFHRRVGSTDRRLLRVSPLPFAPTRANG
jgi:hypothetical protein